VRRINCRRGKWHNERPGFARGFGAAGNVFFGGMNGNQYRVRVHREFDPSGMYDPRSAGDARKFSSELFADAAVDFLSTHKGDAPFFAYCAFTSPHDPRTPPPPYSTMYDPAKMDLPPNFLPEHPFDNGELKIRDEMLAPFPRTAENSRKQLCDYYGMVSSQDEQVGRMLQALENSGRAENTLIVYTGDHGLAIGSHGLFGKQNVYEHSVGVPMVLRGPGVGHGKSDALVYGMDLFPTICRLTGVDAPSGLEGTDLTEVVGGKERVRDFAFHAYIAQGKKGSTPRTQHAIREERWKYIRYRVEGKTTTQLFDLREDPLEMRDLSREAAASGEVERLEKVLVRQQAELGEPGAFRNA
jgi:arylsulfatase A-like enzyme